MTEVLHRIYVPRKSTKHAMWITPEVICHQWLPGAHSCSFFHLFMGCSYRGFKKGVCDATFTSTRRLRECATLLCWNAFVRNPTTNRTRSIGAARNWACLSSR